MSQPLPARASNRPTAWLWVVVLGLAALRFFRLGEWGLWIDEAFTLHDLRAALDGREPWPANPLGYRMVALWIDFVGSSSELALRMLPACFGAALLGLAYWAARPFVGARTALVAATLLGANTWALYWAQNARFYSIAQALCVVGAGALGRALFGAAGSGPWRAFVWLIAALASFALAALTHPSSALFAGAAVVAAWGLWFARVRPGAAQGRVALALAVLALGSGLVMLPWARDLWLHYRESKSTPSPLHFVATTGYHVTPWLALATLGGVLATWRVRATISAGRPRGAFAAWLALALAVTLAAALGLSTQARVSAQYVFVALPVCAWLAAIGLDALGARWPRRARAALVLMLALSLADQAHYFFARHGDRERWREAYQFVWDTRGADDLVVGMSAPVGEYYLAPDSRSFRQPLALVPLTTHNAFVTTQWARRGRRIWYVVLDEWLEEWPRDERVRLQSFLEESGRKMAEFPVRHPFRDLTVRVWLVE